MSAIRTSTNAPFPPRELAARVASAADPDPVRAMDLHGRMVREMLLSMLPLGWSFAGKRVLDFGCGPGTVLRHFLSEASVSEFVGCDVHEPSIVWVQEAMCPPVRAFVNSESPPLDLPDGHFDLILAISVFGHITDQWSSWLLELHRVLAADGIVIATVMGEGVAEAVSGEPWSEDLVGMNVFQPDASVLDAQGPMVLHSPWWLQSHWGRIFELEIFDQGVAGRHMALKLRKRPVSLTTEVLERPDPAEPREASAMPAQVAAE